MEYALEYITPFHGTWRVHTAKISKGVREISLAADGVEAVLKQNADADELLLLLNKVPVASTRNLICLAKSSQ